MAPQNRPRCEKSHSGRPQTQACRFPTFGRAVCGGALAPEPPRATRSQLEFMRTGISPKTLFPLEKSCWAWRKSVWALKYVYPFCLFSSFPYPPGSTPFNPMGLPPLFPDFYTGSTRIFWKIRCFERKSVLTLANGEWSAGAKAGG